MRVRLLLSALLALAQDSIANPLIEPDRHVPLVQFRSSPQHENDPAVAFVGAKGLMVWKESGIGSAIAIDVHLAVTSDAGATWASLPPLPRSDAHYSPPVLAPGPQERVHYLSVFPAQVDLQQLRLETADLASGSVVWVRNTLLPLGHSAIMYPDIACHRGTGALHVTYTHYDRLSGPSSPCRVYYVRSPDGGATWSTPVVLSGEGSDRSRVALGPDGEVYVAWVDALAERVRLRRSDDGGASFGAAVEVGTFLDNRNTGMYEWWEPQIKPHPLYESDMGVPNTPRLVVDHSLGPTRGRVHLGWSDHAEGVRGPRTGSRGEVEPNNTLETATLAAIGEDLGGGVPNADFGGGDGDVWAFDGVAGQVLELTGTVVYSPTPPYAETRIQLVSCERPGEGLVTLARTNTARSHDMDPPAADVRPMLVTLPRTGRYYLIVGGAGPYALGYEIYLREWQVSPGSAARDHRDVVVTSSGDRGASWGAKRRVGDAPHLYDESHPELLVDTSGRLHVTWMDRRHEPVCGARSDTYWAVSFDGGGSFTLGQRLSSASTTWASAPQVIEEFPGQRTALAQSGEWLVAFWPDKRQIATRGSDIWGTRMQVGDLVSSTLARFTAEPRATGVQVAWQLVQSRGLASVTLERERADAPGYAPLPEQSPDPLREGVHEVVDGEAEPGRAYRYRLALVRSDGTSWHEGPLEVTAAERELALAWEPPVPNPSVGRTRLALSLPRAGRAQVEVYDVAGTRVARVHEGALEAGRHAWQWPRADTPPAAPGIYLVRARTEGRSVTARVVVTR